MVSVGLAHADVVELAAVAQCHRTSAVDVVVTDSGLGEWRLSASSDVALSSERQACIGGHPRA